MIPLNKQHMFYDAAAIKFEIYGVDSIKFNPIFVQIYLKS